MATYLLYSDAIARRIYAVALYLVDIFGLGLQLVVSDFVNGGG